MGGDDSAQEGQSPEVLGQSEPRGFAFYFTLTEYAEIQDQLLTCLDLKQPQFRLITRLNRRQTGLRLMC